MQIHIPFKERFREPMLNGTKIMTSRTKRYGREGDYFNAFGRTFALTCVQAMPFSFIVNNWRIEGCSSKEDFLAVWKEIHPRKALNPQDMFWVHSFSSISSKEAKQ
jgi:hypothetical protein